MKTNGRDQEPVKYTQSPERKKSKLQATHTHKIRRKQHKNMPIETLTAMDIKLVNDPKIDGSVPDKL